MTEAWGAWITPWSWMVCPSASCTRVTPVESPRVPELTVTWRNTATSQLSTVVMVTVTISGTDDG